MRQLYVLDRRDITDLRNGLPFTITLANGSTVTLQAEGAFKRPADSNGAAPRPARRPTRSHSAAFKARAVKALARDGITKTAKKFDLHPSLLAAWKRKATA